MQAMSENVKRTYRSPRRAEAAQETRKLIREAAVRLFVAQGVSATTMRQIAEAAGVAERTVYSAFPTKAVLFNEVVNVATVGDESPVPVAGRADFTATFTATDPRTAVTTLVDFGCALLDRAGDLIMAAIESAGADPDLREFNDRSSEAMTANLLTVAKAWKRNGLLREGLDAKSAAAMLYTLGSPHVYHLMRRRQGWTTKRYRDWLVDSVMRTVMRET
jgi:AcrR family transcriptional regulator